MLTPLAIAGRFVVYPSQELEVINGYLGRLDAKFLIQLANCRPPHALNRLLQT